MDMRIKTITLFLALVSYAPCFAQLSIEACYEKARANYPLIKQYGLIEKTKEYNLSNAAKGYLPQVTFSAQATYQSDVTEIPINLDAIGLTGVEIPSVSQDQYKMELALSQTLWDGGAIRSERKALHTQAEVDQRDMDVNMYTINERVNQLYFGVLLADAQLEQNKVLQAELRRSCEQVSSYIKNGIAQQSDLDAIRVDLLKAKQTEAQFEHTKRAYREMLSRLIGEEIGEETRLVKPEAVRPLTKENNRPELGLYQAQIQNLEAQDSRITAGIMPKLGLFVTGGYGKPGLDMFEDNFKAYYLAGVRLSWNLGSLYTVKDDRRKIQASIRAIETQRETFLFNTSLDVAQRDASIDKYVAQLRYDDEIIALRGSVRRASEAKMANGTLSGTNLTRDIHAEQSAIQDKILHEIELLMAIYNLRYAINNE